MRLWMVKKIYPEARGKKKYKNVESELKMNFVYEGVKGFLQESNRIILEPVSISKNL